MQSEEAIKLLEEFTMSIVEYLSMKHAHLLMEAKNMRPAEASARKMDEISEHGKIKANQRLLTPIF